MTEKPKKEKKHFSISPSAISNFHLEARRTVHGMSLIIGGVIGISDFSAESVLLKSHSGRILVVGRYLYISIFEGGVVEIIGKVEDIRFSYGKN